MTRNGIHTHASTTTRVWASGGSSSLDWPVLKTGTQSSFGTA
jgi:hypothetical protein